ncbi:type IV pili methyl-accepting chemotaxis transducer N-terminal domain-containing protein [Yoonia litorea]|uniref:Type IV pili methyl-accepting chemotaxis transducer N-term n=1 Tax=Yoonia litorea TaxID=1123755 RepID=A0A1I6N0W5_9RHOB|nr:type IV pili methyl-accepting chemotaxis transducer N-terminal domain-containing protein [Yoonia litorea]SFS21576.1 Type IV pili methyl-accepting chemotaxis transducer N-term [Yoonia litorea]
MHNRDSESQRSVLTTFANAKGGSQALIFALAVIAFPTTGLWQPTIANAETANTEVANGGKARVSRSASLRSLTEAVASASCRIDAGIGTDLARAELKNASEDFSAIITGLIDGDPALGMPGPERRARTLTSLQATADLWKPLASAAQNLATGAGESADATIIAANYAELFAQTEQTASDVSGQYADPQSLLQSDATVLNFAVRQRALAYRMTRAMCQLAAGTGDETTAAELAETVDLFDRTLIALRDGFPAAGINPPPNETVSDRLSEIFTVWRGVRGIYDNAIAGNTPTVADVEASADLTARLSVAMNNAITLYLIATPGQDDVYRIPLEAYARNELAGWMTDPAVIAALQSQNMAHSDLNEDAVVALDQQWRAEAGEGGGPLINRLLSSDVSGWLRTKQDATAGFVTEVFVMDNKGLNVAQSVETSDYWQGDEAKWQQTYLVGPEALHISDVEFDDSTGFYQSQASLPITDPDTGEVIGAVTFGINVQSLM